MDLEELQLQLEKVLCEVSKDILIKLAVFLKLDEVKYQGKSKLSITRLLEREIEEQVAQIEDENQCCVFLKKIQLIEITDKEAPPKEIGNKELEVLKQQLDNMEKDHQNQVEALKSKMEESELKATATSVSKPTTNDLKSVLRREFKINGQIGEPGQKDKLTFVSLVRQIESASSKGYSETEVIDGEKSATELYQQLTTIVQSPEESPQSFLIRALDLHQKVLFASKEAGVKITYDESLVQGLFLHSLETGLHHEAVRTKLRPFLQQPDITDELLIEQMNIIVSTETERQKKFGTASQARQ
ncbi:Hypothetical predicted protein [Paramuricea clavata]|uniref:Uncharacterized protein n=1 Tax=Paramuricea clavata TaxID=317549 RepID=A0A7D9IMY2_PARCT|nr:Hypothetical predicted protein [Paramuricea clavata]